MKEQENIIESTEIKVDITKRYVTELAATLANMKTFFNEQANQLQALSEDMLGTCLMSKNKNTNDPVEKNVADQVEVKINNVINFINQNIKEDKAADNSYITRSKKAILENLQMQLNGDAALLKKDSDAYDYYYTTFSDYPTPLFTTGKKDNRNKPEYAWNADKYEEFMKTAPFLEQYEDRTEYDKKYRLPYLKAKEKGTVTEAQQKEYKYATYEHLKKQKEYFQQLINYPENETTKSIYPFAHNRNGLLLDWKGDRFAKKRLEDINREIKALEHGWSPDDFDMLNETGALMKLIDKSEQMSEPERNKYREIYNNLTNAYVSTPEERMALIQSVKPFYDIQPKMTAKIRNTFEDVQKKTSFIAPLKADDRKREEMINSLNDFMKGLNTGHRVGTHTDTGEMQELKKMTRDVIKLLKDNRDINIYEDDRFKKAFEELGKKADTYVKKKREKFEQEVRAELTDPDIDPNSMEGREQERKIFNELKKFKPSSKMGQIRYDSANALLAKCKEYSTHLDSQQKLRSTLKEKYTDKGFNVISNEDLENASRHPYDRPLKETLNYYQKTPALIVEGYNKKVFDEDSFKKTCAPIKCDGISEEDFALVAYASVQDASKVPKEVADTLSDSIHPDVTKEDKVSQIRTMYTIDLGVSRRDHVGTNYGEKLIKPARERAKDALEKYKKGDKKDLADILATAISAINEDATCIDNISGRTSSFMVHEEMISKMLEYAKKDSELYKAVTDKLGPEKMRDVQDNLKLKDYFDKCVRSEEILNDAAKTGKQLSKATKQKCIRNIVRYDFIASMYGQFKTEQRENNKEFMAMDKNYSKMLADIMTGKNKTMKKDDLIILHEKLGRTSYKPIPQIHGRFHSEKGMKKLNGVINEFSSKFPASSSPKTIMNQLDGFRNQLEDTQRQMYQKGKEAEREQARKEAEAARKRVLAGKNNKTNTQPKLN